MVTRILLGLGRDSESCISLGREGRGGEGREGAARQDAGAGENLLEMQKEWRYEVPGEGGTVYYTSERGNMEIIHSYLSMPVMKSG
jgi:hypothetical protein